MQIPKNSSRATQSQELNSLRRLRPICKKCLPLRLFSKKGSRKLKRHFWESITAFKILKTVWLLRILILLHTWMTSARQWSRDWWKRRRMLQSRLPWEEPLAKLQRTCLLAHMISPKLGATKTSYRGTKSTMTPWTYSRRLQWRLLPRSRTSRASLELVMELN